MGPTERPPKWIKPQLTRLVEEAPTGTGWLLAHLNISPNARSMRRRTVDIFSMLAEAADRTPDKALIVDRFGCLSYASGLQQAELIARNLVSLGVRQGDRIAVQLPNWRHFPLLEYAAARVGAVMVPLPPIYRRRELRLMLGLAQPVVAVCPDVFRGFDHAAMLRDLQQELPGLLHLVVVGDERPAAALPFERLLQPCTADLPPASEPDALVEIAFTSGTTGEPKGVMHSTRTLLSTLINLAEDQKLDAATVILMASTFGHQTGFAFGGLLVLLLGGTLVLMERWDAKEGVALIDREKATWMMGATPFLQDVVEAVRPVQAIAAVSRPFSARAHRSPVRCSPERRATAGQGRCRLGHDRSGARDPDPDRRSTGKDPRFGWPTVAGRRQHGRGGEITNDGLPKSRSSMVCGRPGAGKTFGIEFLARGARFRRARCGVRSHPAGGCRRRGGGNHARTNPAAVLSAKSTEP